VFLEISETRRFRKPTVRSRKWVFRWTRKPQPESEAKASFFSELLCGFQGCAHATNSRTPENPRAFQSAAGGVNPRRSERDWRWFFYE
jgi:hypothetical protein